MQQLRFFIRIGFTLHVSGDNLTHHQEYNAVYGMMHGTTNSKISYKSV